MDAPQRFNTHFFRNKLIEFFGQHSPVVIYLLSFPFEEKLAKIADAKASYDAWKEKKAEIIRKKVKENQEAINQQQMEMDKKQEKKETAKQVSIFH